MTRASALALATTALGLAISSELAAQAAATTPDDGYGCVVCHAEHRRAFVSGVHAERGIRCHVCHGGDTTALELPAAHRGRFLGRPGKRQIAALCASCHSDPNRMRQYGLPSDQLAALHTSRHGQLLQRGDSAAPTCTDCHESHTILRRTDARSNTYPTNIPVLCARCHADATLMARYGLATDQFAEYAASAHGEALFQRAEFAAPTCVGCHGSHSALPPGTTQITDVCGRCHTLERDALVRGPHGPAASAARLPGCLACHSNHGTESVPPDSVARRCGACHAAGTAADSVARVLQERISEAEQGMAVAREGVATLQRYGRPVTDQRLRFAEATTWYEQMALVQHSLELDRLEDLSLRVASATRTITDAAEVAGEQRWEHKLLLLPVWFLALAIAALAWFRAQGPESPEVPPSE